MVLDEETPEEKLTNMYRKLGKVLILKKKIESRRLSLLSNLSSVTDPDQTKIYLSNLKITCRGEERFLVISEIDLIEALKILDEVEAIVNNVIGFRQGLKAKIPIIGKRYRNVQSLTRLMKMLYKYSRKQIIVLYESFDSIKENIREQHKQILDLILDIKTGMETGVHINFSENVHFGKIEELHKAEMDITNETMEKLNPRKGKMLMYFNRIQIILSKSKILIPIQAGMGIAPMANPGASAAVVVALGLTPPLAFIVWPTLIFVKWSPAIAVGSAILLEKPAKRAKKAATLRMKAIKMKLEVPPAMMKELATIAAGGTTRGIKAVAGDAARRAQQAANIFRQPPKRPAYA